MSLDADPTPDEIDDLARHAQAGDSGALERLLGVVRPRVLSVCRGVLPFQPDAEDACQEALLSISQRLGSWDQRGRFTTWMHVVAMNAARTTYRRLKGQAAAADAGHRESPDPRTTSVIAGTRLDLLEAMETLDREHPQLVAPLLLRDVYDLTYADIAGELGLPLGTVKAQVHQGRKLTRPMLVASEGRR